MRAIIQRVSHVTLTINEQTFSEIGKGLLVLVGIEEADTTEDIKWLAPKIANMRIFSDAEGLMNLSVLDTDGELLVVSQFTLFAQTKKGNRPSFIRAAKPDIAIPLYEQFVKELHSITQKTIKTGQFGADMQINLINDGPVTIFIDSKNRE